MESQSLNSWKNKKIFQYHVVCWKIYRDAKHLKGLKVIQFKSFSSPVQTFRNKELLRSHFFMSFADRKDMKKFFDALKTVYGPQSSGTTPLLSADETSLLTDKEAILKRWAEHFDGVLNRPSSINDEAINRLPQVECNPLLDELPTVSETVKAIKLLSSGKAPGSDAEIYKAGDPPVAEKLTELFHIMWRKEAIPQEFKDATINHLFKRKGNPQSVTIIEASLYCQ